MKETLESIGEKEIINRLAKFMPIGQINNDTAEINVEKKNKDDNNKDIMTFGDYLDVPAFMRNKNS